ncbi:MAG: arginyltransferase [Alphaproteobacteria bacterium]|nr:arginyltransferase [Alphaproteobacteria bacterium]
MTRQTPDSAQFFLTTESECPYLDGHRERKLFTHLSGRRAHMMHALLSDHGFRRSQNLVYRPACDGCEACRSVRIVVGKFSPGKSLRRIGAANRDITAIAGPPQVTAEQYDLFQRYLRARHAGGGMTQMSFVDYEFMVEDTPVDTMIVEYRIEDGVDRPLAGVALTDRLPNGLSMVYSFFDPRHAERGLGNYMILEHIARAAAAELGYVYLGYWVKNSPKMAYKARFGPLEVQSGPSGWRPLDPEAG